MTKKTAAHFIKRSIVKIARIILSNRLRDEQQQQLKERHHRKQQPDSEGIQAQIVQQQDKNRAKTGRFP